MAHAKLHFGSPIPPPVIGEIRYINLHNWTDIGRPFSTTSLPGHLIQCMLTGVVHQSVSGQVYTLKPGDLIWYYQDELHEGHILQAPWSYYTINFISEGLSPPPFDKRVWRVGSETVSLFKDVYEAWADDALPPLRKAMHIQARLLLLLSALTSGEAEAFHSDPEARLWWDVERRVREDLSQSVDLSTIETRSGRSAATIARACRAALGMSPIKRIKHIRLSHADGLLRMSEMSITEIAHRVGYKRVHEFSRDFHKHFGRSPTEERALRPPVET